MVDGELEQIVRAAIAHTDRMLEQGHVTVDVALRAIEKLAADLVERWPQYEAWIRSQLCGWARGHAN